MAEPWDTMRALFPDNSTGDIGADDMRTQVDLLETNDDDNVKDSELSQEVIDELQTQVAMLWRGNWTTGITYQIAEVVFDEGWLMIANKQTNEKAAPTPIGSAYWGYDGDALDTTTANNVRQIVTGTRYTPSGAQYINGYRIYAIAGNRYDVISVADPEGVKDATFQNSFVASETGWREFGLTPILALPGETFDLLTIVTEPDPAPVVTPLTYDYSKPNNTAPLPGQCVQRNTTPSTLEFHNTDDLGGDQSTFLATVNIGDKIIFNGTEWTVQSVDTSPANQTNFGVAPGVQGAPEGQGTFSFEQPALVTISYGIKINHYAGDAQASGLYVADDSWENVLPNDNAYNTDVLIQQVNVSEDWDVLATSDVGSGQATFTPTYDYEKTVAFTVPSDTFSEVDRMTLTSRDAGTYEIKMTWTATCDTTTDAMEFQWSTDGGSNWNTFSIEPSDASDVYPFAYFYPYTHDGGQFEIIFQARKTNVANTMTIDFLDIIFERKP